MYRQLFRPGSLEAAQEDMAALFSYNKPKQVPNGTMWYSAEFSLVNTNWDLGKVFNDPAAIYEAICRSADQYRWNPWLQYAGFSALASFDFGGRMTFPSKNGEVLTPAVHPVQSEADVEKLSLPDPATSGDTPRMLEFARLQQQNGFPVSFMTRSPFCMAANMAGLNRFLTWLVGKPELCRRMMELAYQHTINTLDVWIKEFGAQNLQVWWPTPIESNDLISPKHMETFALPYHLKYGQHLKDLGVTQVGLHFCGDQNRNLPLVAEADPWPHPAILSFGPETDISDAARIFPRDIIFGNVESTLLEKGTPAQVFEASKGLVEKGKRIEGGFILAPSCDPPMFTPPANMYAMTKAVEEFGNY